MISKEEQRNNILKRISELKRKGEEIAHHIMKKNMECKTETPLNFCETIGYLQPEFAIEREKREGSLYKALNFMFKHFSANISNTERTNDIVKSYVTTGNASPTLNRFDCANENGISSVFEERIISSIKILEKIKTQEFDKNRLFTWIVGYKGCGKTTFINYFLSQKEKNLNNIYKSISVRIDVADIQKDIPLRDAIQWKICKILFNYYCIDSEKNNDRAFFSINDIITNTGRDSTEISNFFHYFIGENNVKNPSGQISNFYALFDLFLRYIKNKHQYTFLIILDNLDQIGIRINDVKNYNKRTEELNTLFVENDQILGAYLLIMRATSISDIKKSTKLQPKIFTLKIASLMDIYILRKQCWFNKLKTKGESIENIKKTENLLDTYVQIIGSSLRSTKEYFNLLTLNEAIANIESFCTYNKRLSINLLRLYGDCCLKNVELSEYLYNTIDKANQEKDLSELLQYGYYRFFEALMLSNGYCCRFNGYDYRDGQLLLSNKTEAHHETRFLLNLFKFPSKAGAPPAYYAVFVKIRILQLLNNLTRINSISIKEMKNILKQIFGYKPRVVDLACQVLIDDGCIEQKYDFFNDNYQPLDNNTSITITDKGRVVLVTFPEKINYLSICFEDMPIPVDYLTKLNDSKICFPIRNYYDKEATNINPFVLENLLYSTPIIVGMLSAIEIYEKNKFGNNKKYNEYFKSSDFELMIKLTEDARKTYNKIIDTYVLNTEQENRYNHYMNLPPSPPSLRKY
jgi:hypothetical protein